MLCNVFLGGEISIYLLTSAEMKNVYQPDTAPLRGPVALSHLFLGQFVKPGEHAVDATCGNGNDTLLLAELVGVEGLVLAFDIQPEAVRQTSAKLSAANLAERVHVIDTGHESMLQYIVRPVKAVVFNLGYLPGGNRDLITRPDTTIAALKLSADLLMPGGIIAVTVYPGHSGGDDERVLVESWAGRLLPREFHVWRMGQTNVAVNAPYLILIQKAVR